MSRLIEPRYRNLPVIDGGYNLAWSPEGAGLTQQCAMSASGLDAQEEVGSREAEEDIRRPGGHGGGKLAQVGHPFEEAGSRPIDDGDADAQRDAREGALAAHGEREGNSDQGNDEGDKRKGELAVELHGEADDVEAALPELADVAAQFERAHLLRGFDFLLEVARLFGQFAESGDGERHVVGKAIATK